MFTHLFFDFFGTLVHFQPNVKRAPRTVHRLRQLGIEVDEGRFITEFSKASTHLESEACKTGVEFTMEQMFEQYFRTSKSSIPPQPELAALGWDFCMDWSDEVTYIEGSRELLQDLGRRYRLSIVSNTHSKDLVKFHLEQKGLSRFFDDIVLSVEWGRRKPCRSIFENALSRRGVAPEKAIFIGDSLDPDWKGPRAVGMNSILIDSTGRYKDDVRDSISHLLDLRGRLLA